MKKYITILLLLLISCSPFSRIDQLYETSDYQGVIFECQKILANDSLNVQAHYKLGKSYLALGKITNAVNSLSLAYRLEPSADKQAIIKPDFIRAKLSLGDSLLNIKEPYKARNQYLSACQLDSLNISCLRKLSDLYYELGNLDDAKLYYVKIITLSPSDTIAMNQIESIQSRSISSAQELATGIALFKDYKYLSSVIHFERSLSYKPDNVDAIFYKALAQGAHLYNKGSNKQLWDAIELFGIAMTHRPTSGEPHFFMGMAYEKKDRREFDSAIEQYRLAIEKEPDGYFNAFCSKKIEELTTLRDRLQNFWNK